MAPTTWTHLIRFIAEEDHQIHLGNVDASKYPDVGLSTFKGEKVAVNLVTGSAFSGTVTEKVLHVERVRHLNPGVLLYVLLTCGVPRSYSPLLTKKKCL
jgi:hypothetical protein